jgi:excisionase family DNA binding protein
MTDDRLMTIDELAAYLQVSDQTIYQWRRRGAGPRGFRVGRYVRFRREDVDAWLDSLGDGGHTALPSLATRRRRAGGGEHAWAG